MPNVDPAGHLSPTRLRTSAFPGRRNTNPKSLTLSLTLNLTENFNLTRGQMPNMVFFTLLAGRRSIVISKCVCLSVFLDVYLHAEPRDRPSPNFLHLSRVAVARSSSGGVAMRYVFPVL